MSQPWFGPKINGIGVAPKGPAGWACVAAYCVLITVAPVAVTALGGPFWAILAVFALLAAAFLALVNLKERARQPNSPHRYEIARSLRAAVGGVPCWAGSRLLQFALFSEVVGQLGPDA
jgi:hypothetical protein